MGNIPKSKLIIAVINIPRLLLHILFFYKHIGVCKEDVRVAMNLRGWDCNVFCGFIYLLVFDKTYRNLFYFRIGKAKYLMWYWLKPHPCFTLATDMKVSPGFLCIHPFSTIINADYIGTNFSVKHSVTVGRRMSSCTNGDKGRNRPIFGNNVTIHCNAVIIGGITIGDNVEIGAGTVLTKSVPSNCTIVGNPAMILKRNGVIVKEKL